MHIGLSASHQPRRAFEVVFFADIWAMYAKVPLCLELSWCLLHSVLQFFGRPLYHYGYFGRACGVAVTAVHYAQRSVKYRSSRHKHRLMPPDCCSATLQCVTYSVLLIVCGWQYLGFSTVCYALLPLGPLLIHTYTYIIPVMWYPQLQSHYNTCVSTYCMVVAICPPCYRVSALWSFSTILWREW